MIDQWRIDTPEAVSLEFQVAGLGSRFLAALIDLLVMSGIGIGFSLAAGIISLFGGAFNTAAVIFILTGFFVLFWGYFVIFETLWSGQTPGKRSIGIRVIKTSGLPIGFIDALIRNLVRIADYLPSLYLAGVITMFISSQSRRLGDYAAGTLVVWEQTSVKLNQLASEMRAAPMPAEVEWHMNSLTADDVDRIRRFFRTAAQVRPEFMRPKLAADLGRVIAEKVRTGPPGQPDAEAFLGRVVALYDGARPVTPTESMVARTPEELAWNLRRLSYDDVQMMDGFLGRALSLREPARTSLATRIARVIAPKIEAPIPADPETFLRRLSRLHQSEQDQNPGRRV